MPKSTTYANAWLDEEYGGVARTRGATVYLALFSVAPTNAGGGTEFSGSGYARLAVARNQTNWPAASNRQVSNGVTMSFATPSGLWGTAVAWGEFSAASGGTMYRWHTLTQSQVVDAAHPAVFDPGTLVITEYGT
jgi:hypothetical protein